MPTLVGVHAPVGAPGEAASLWEALTRDLGAPAASLVADPLRAAIFPEHAGDRALCPDAPAAAAGTAIGFGGDDRRTPPSRLVPPWLMCRWDPSRRAAIVETDRHGFVLVFVRVVGDCVAFSTSAARLGRAAPCAPLDPRAIAEMLAFDHLLGERTLRREVRAVPQGCAVEIGPSGVSFPRRFHYRDLPLDRRARPRAAVDALIPLWREGIAGALAARGDRRVLVPLSGGLDSRLIAATAVEAGAPIEAFTFARARTQAPDVLIAAEVARILGVPWRALDLPDDWLADEAARAIDRTDGHLDILHAHGISLVGAFSPGQLRLDGFAGDVVLGGSFLRRELLAARAPDQRVELLFRARSRLTQPAWARLLLPDAREELLRLARASLATSLEGYPDREPRWSDFWVLQHRIRRFTLNGPQLWTCASRSAFPFFAPGFLDRLLAVPPAARLGAALQARFLWQGWPRMAAIPWQRTGWPVPRGGLRESLIRRLRKPAHAPGGTFFDGDAAFRSSPRLRHFLRDLLLDPSTGAGRFGCFDTAEIERLLRDTEAGARRGIPQLSLLATLVLSERAWAPQR